MMESVKRGPMLEGEARDWFVLRLADLALEHGDAAIERAIATCLDDSPFRPDVSDIRKALGVTAGQQAKVESETARVDGAAAWLELRAYIARYARRNVEGQWLFEPQIRIVYDNGVPVMVQDSRGRPCVKSERLPMPALSAQPAWCLQQVGGLNRVADCADEYIEIVRKEFLSVWPLYRAPAWNDRQIEAGDVEYVDVDAMIQQRMAAA